MPPKKPQKAQQRESTAEEEETPTESASVEEGIQPIDVSKVVKGTMVMCKHTDGIYYEAKVIDVTEKDGVRHFAVHYLGWNKRHDEKISEAKAQDRFREHRAEIAEHFKNLHKEKVGKTPRKSTAGTPSEKADRESSRGNTPAAKSTPRAASSLSTTDAAGTPVSKPPRRGTAAEPRSVSEHTRKDVTPTVAFTESLRDILVDDQDKITSQKKLAKLPARHTVQNIINDYITSIDEKDEHGNVLVEHSGGMSLAGVTKSSLKESAIGLLDYFDATIGNRGTKVMNPTLVYLGSMLIYKFERPQYAALLEAEKEKLAAELRDKEDNDNALPQSRPIRMSHQYGFVHLLRMFVRLGEILSYSAWTPRSMETIMKHAQDLVLFLSKKAPEYYDAKHDYVDATAEYEKSVSATHA
ncbi:MRG family protein [Aphelenchoides avenae]|nr:MRG family protein [Aphelenchus avenae]